MGFQAGNFLYDRALWNSPSVIAFQLYCGFAIVRLDALSEDFSLRAILDAGNVSP
jgi:hypothetical protein